MSAPYDNYDYQNYWRGRDYEHESEAITLTEFFNSIPQNLNLLEIGAGFGRLIPIYAQRCREITLLDPSSKNLHQAQKITKKLDKKIILTKGIGENLPFTDESFDAVISVRVLHHIPSPQPLISEAHRVLKPGGYLILEFANKLNLKSRLSSWVTGDRSLHLLHPKDLRSKSNQIKKSIPFVNHHPDFIIKTLKTASFQILKIRSVSNLRHPFLKQLFPLKFNLQIEKLLQQLPLFGLNYFGPSIFTLSQKPPLTEL